MRRHPSRGGCCLPPFRIEARRTSLEETIDWGLAAYNVPNHWRNTSGQGVRVAVLDTGIDAQHADLSAAIDRVGNFAPSGRATRDANGHGTHVAGIIAARRNGVGLVGVAPECRLLVARVLDDRGRGSDGSVAAGIEWAVQAGADVLSLSLGMPGYSARIAAAIGRAVQAGRYVVCAAGNSGRLDSVDFPARLAETLAVGAVDRRGRVARFSSRGPQVDLCAPGEDILSTWTGGGYARLSGTSMAAPFVTGIVALVLAQHRRQPGRTPVTNTRQLLEHLRRTALDAGPAGHDPHYGYGLINPDALLAAAAHASPWEKS
jgi:subtilisin family serine protease